MCNANSADGSSLPFITNCPLTCCGSLDRARFCAKYSVYGGPAMPTLARTAVLRSAQIRMLTV